MIAYVHKCVSFVHINGTYLSDPFRENEWPPLSQYNMSTPHLSNRDLSMPSCQFHNLRLVLIQISMGDAWSSGPRQSDSVQSEIYPAAGCIKPTYEQSAPTVQLFAVRRHDVACLRPSCLASGTHRSPPLLGETDQQMASFPAAMENQQDQMRHEIISFKSHAKLPRRNARILPIETEQMGPATIWAKSQAAAMMHVRVSSISWQKVPREYDPAWPAIQRLQYLEQSLCASAAGAKIKKKHRWKVPTKAEKNGNSEFSCLNFRPFCPNYLCASHSCFAFLFDGHRPRLICLEPIGIPGRNSTSRWPNKGSAIDKNRIKWSGKQRMATVVGPWSLNQCVLQRLHFVHGIRCPFANSTPSCCRLKGADSQTRIRTNVALPAKRLTWRGRTIGLQCVDLEHPKTSSTRTWGMRGFAHVCSLPMRKQSLNSRKSPANLS